MRKVFAWVMAVTLTACGGKVFVDAPSGSTGSTGNTGGNGGNGGAGGTQSTSSVFDGAGGGCVSSCNDAINSGLTPCGGQATEWWKELLSCACGVSCASQCQDICNGGPLTSKTCLDCLPQSCGAEYMNCVAN